jgi:hypothetical protein
MKAKPANQETDDIRGSTIELQMSRGCQVREDNAEPKIKDQLQHAMNQSRNPNCHELYTS